MTNAAPAVSPLGTPASSFETPSAGGASAKATEAAARPGAACTAVFRTILTAEDTLEEENTALDIHTV